MDEYRIDSHKLIFHVLRVQEWLEGRTIYPIYMEVSPAGACNHRCTFCALDFIGYQPRFLDGTIFQRRLAELGKLGLKSILYGGEGEVLLNKWMPNFLRQGQAAGIDNAITTNGVLLTKDLAAEILPRTAWIKVSFNAGTARTYAAVHQTRPEDFDTVLANLADAVALKRAKGYSCTLGLQMILLPENRAEAATLAKIARDVGLDYLVIKPYSHHPRSLTRRYKDVNYTDDLDLGEQLRPFHTPTFQVIFRRRAMQKWDAGDRPYRRCQALPFWSYIDAGGNVWGCSAYLNDERFLYGNIHDSTFQEIWEGARRTKHLAWVASELDPCQCRVNCRMDEINRYLWELKNPPPHVNFI